jgi:YHS domain-containing protein
MNPEGEAMPGGHQHGEETTVEEAPAPGTPEAIQPMCPVMGGPIDPNVFIEYKGKRVYFCCQGCDDQFLANPERYLDKLPQFNDPNDATDSEMNHTEHEP